MKKTSIIKTELICPECGSIMPIIRKQSKQKNLYHIKDLYCINCSKITKQIEVKQRDILIKQLQFNTKLTKEEKYIYDLLNKPKILIKKGIN